MLKEKLMGLPSWIIIFATESIITRAIINSLYQEGYKFPETFIIL